MRERAHNVLDRETRSVCEDYLREAIKELPGYSVSNINIPKYNVCLSLTCYLKIDQIKVEALFSSFQAGL